MMYKENKGEGKRGENYGCALIVGPLGVKVSKVGVPTSPLEVEMSLIYTKLPKNFMEHSIYFHPIPPCSMV
jgi:hypothetical protein